MAAHGHIGIEMKYLNVEYAQDCIRCQQVQWLELQYNEWYVPMRFLYLVHCRERRVVLRNEVLTLIVNLILLVSKPLSIIVQAL